MKPNRTCAPQNPWTRASQAWRARAPGGFDSSPAQVMFVAVDNSAGSSSGDVYVADFAEHGAGNRVSKFSSSGALLSGWGEGGELDGAGVKHPPAELPGPFGPIEGIAVDPSGNLWVAGEHVTFQFNSEAVVQDRLGDTGRSAPVWCRGRLARRPVFH